MVSPGEIAFSRFSLKLSNSMVSLSALTTLTTSACPAGTVTVSGMKWWFSKRTSKIRASACAAPPAPSIASMISVKPKFLPKYLIELYIELYSQMKLRMILNTNSMGLESRHPTGPACAEAC